MKKLIVLLLILTAKSVFAADSNCDTITHWKLYKDSKAIWASNYFDSKRLTIEIPVSEKFENLNFEIFYDFNREILDRKVELICEGKVIAVLNDKNYSYEKFIIPKSIFFDANSKYFNQEIHIKYIDKINPKGIIIGIVNLRI